MAQKQLTISLLISGKSDTTEKCLNSLKPLMEAVDSELILVDTGCDEAMKQVLARYTEHVVPFEWCNDFAKARNVGLKLATGEWFMAMDDDEWFEDVTPIIHFFQNGMCKEYDQAVYKARNYADYEGKSYTDEWVSRIIRIEEDTCYTGKVHEILGPARGKCAMLDAYVHHFGYVNVDSDALRRKVMRNVPLLQDMIAEEPNNLRWRIQILQEYACIYAYDEIIREAQSALDFISKIDKRFVNQCRNVFQTAMLRALFMNKDEKTVMDLGEKFLADTRNTNQGNAAICYYGAEAERSMRQKETMSDVTGKNFSEKYLTYYNAWKQEELSEQETIIEQSLLFVKDVTTESIYFDMLRRYAVQCVRDRNKTNTLTEEYRIHLTELVQRMLYKNADFLNLAEDIWLLADAGVIDVEKQWLALELEQWEAALQLLKSRGIVSLEQARTRIDRYRTTDDIRYSYFRKEYVSVIMKLESQTESYEQLVKRFFDFMEGTLEYYLWIFNDEAFTGEMEMLPADAKAAFWLNQMFLREENDWVQKIRDLRECAKVYPVLGNNIKRLLNMIKEAI